MAREASLRAVVAEEEHHMLADGPHRGSVGQNYVKKERRVERQEH